MKQILLLLLISFSLTAQVNGVVLDSISGKPIAYVNIWVENENIGTTSEENGVFSLDIKEEKNIIFSALGYETKTIKSAEIKQVYLKAIVYEMEEIMVSEPKKTKKITINKYKKNKINLYYGAGKQPTILAKKIEYTDQIAEYSYLKEIKFLSLSEIEKAKIILRFFEVDIDGKPSNDYIDENILITVEKGKNDNTINLEEYKINIPKKGLFIAFESIIIEENRYDYEVRLGKEGTEYKRDYNYQPFIGTIPSENNLTFKFMVGKWFESKKNKFEDSKIMNKYQDKFGELAIELTLTN